MRHIAAFFIALMATFFGLVTTPLRLWRVFKVSYHASICPHCRQRLHRKMKRELRED